MIGPRGRKQKGGETASKVSDDTGYLRSEKQNKKSVFDPDSTTAVFLKEKVNKAEDLSLFLWMLLFRSSSLILLELAKTIYV